MPKSAKPAWTHRHLLGLENLSAAEIELLLDTADGYMPCVTHRRPCRPVLEGRTVLNLFCENSTRTRTSFTFAAERLGARVFQFDTATSSLTKRESLHDTVQNIDAMGLDAIVIRHQEREAPHRVAEAVSCSVLNAGDDSHEHPTQALLDMLALRHTFGRLDGLTVAVVGDIRHSRVARSNLYALSKFGSRVVFVGPQVFLDGTEDIAAPFEHTTNFDKLLPECDAVMMLRVQFERHAGLEFDADEYKRGYQLTAARLARAKPGAVALHPGPVNRGLEITDEVCDGQRSVILHQVTCGVAVRMAALSLCITALERERKCACAAPKPRKRTSGR